MNIIAINKKYKAIFELSDPTLVKGVTDYVAARFTVLKSGQWSYSSNYKGTGDFTLSEYVFLNLDGSPWEPPRDPVFKKGDLVSTSAYFPAAWFEVTGDYYEGDERLKVVWAVGREKGRSDTFRSAASPFKVTIKETAVRA